jgi:hypothetical protein
VSIRDVRPTDDFYRDLDKALVLAGGVISRSDFGLYVLPGILSRFALDWDQLPMPIPGRADYRIVIGYSGYLARRAGVPFRGRPGRGRLGGKGSVPRCRPSRSP